MKKTIYAFLLLFVTASLLYISGCKKDPVNNPLTNMPAETAKVEIRSASQEITGKMDEVMASQAATTLDFFANISNVGEEDWKTNLKPSLRGMEKLKPSNVKNIIKSQFSLKNTNEPDPKVGGVYKYNYTTEDFDLINAGVSYLQFIFPADDEDFYSGGWNATMTITNYQYTLIEEEELPTMFEIELIAYSVECFAMTYSATFDADGAPTSMSVTINMPPYTITMSESVSGANYNSTFSFKENNTVIMSYNISVQLTTDKENIVKISGHYQVSPIRLEGFVNVMDTDLCTENDIACMNNNISVAMIHTAYNQIIGRVEYRLFYDDIWDEYYPDLVIVYADDTWEWLADIFDVDFRK